jgi:hypothetical protein
VSWCAIESTPRASPLTIVGLRFAKSGPIRSAICVPKTGGRLIPTIARCGVFKVDASPLTYNNTGGH